MSFTHFQHRSLGARRCCFMALVVAVAGLAFGAPASLASTTSVYWDNNDNVGAGPFPFNGTFTGTDNIASGPSMMQSLTSGGFNVADGSFALSGDTGGDENVATGYRALGSNTTGDDNLATGHRALEASTTGADNVASGAFALSANTTGGSNVASGSLTLANNTSGNDNVADGMEALFSATGSNNVGLGSFAGTQITSGSNNVDIANRGVAGDSGKIRIGSDANQNATYIAGIWNKGITGPTKAVVINKNGRLGIGPAPAAPLQEQARTVNRLRAQLRAERAKNRRQDAAIRQLRGLVRQRTG